MKLTHNPEEYARRAAGNRAFARDAADRLTQGGTFDGLTQEILWQLLAFLANAEPTPPAGRPRKGYRESRREALLAASAAVKGATPATPEDAAIAAAELRLWAARLTDTKPRGRGRPVLFEKGEAAVLFLVYRRQGMGWSASVDRVAEAYDVDRKRVEEAIAANSEGMAEALAFAKSWGMDGTEK